MIIKYIIACVLIISYFASSYADTFGSIRYNHYVVIDNNLDDYEKMQAELVEKKNQFDSLKNMHDLNSKWLSSTMEELKREFNSVIITNPSPDELSSKANYFERGFGKTYQIQQMVVENIIDMDVVARNIDELEYRIRLSKEKDDHITKPITSNGNLINKAMDDKNNLDKKLKRRKDEQYEQIAELKKRITELETSENKYFILMENDSIFTSIFNYINNMFHAVMGIGTDNYKQMQAELVEKKSQFNILQRNKKLFSDVLSSNMYELNQQLDILNRELDDVSKKQISQSLDDISAREDHIDMLLARVYILDEKILEHIVDMNALAKSIDETSNRGYYINQLLTKDLEEYNRQTNSINKLEQLLKENDLIYKTINDRNNLDKELKSRKDKVTASNGNSIDKAITDRENFRKELKDQKSKVEKTNPNLETDHNIVKDKKDNPDSFKTNSLVNHDVNNEL